MTGKLSAVVCASMLACGAGAVEGSAPTQPQTAIAAKYPGDVGIANDPAVMFHDDFERAKPGSRWTRVKRSECVFAETDPKIARGRQSARCVMTPKTRLGISMVYTISPRVDVLHMRHYARYGTDFGYLHHGGSGFSAAPEGETRPGGQAGIRPTKYFSSTFEPSRHGGAKPPGQFGFYTYWWQMDRGRSGRYWGDSGKNCRRPSPPQNPGLEKWTCIEWRVKANTPGEPDGELDCWFNGVHCGRWRDVNWRNAANIRIYCARLSLYMESGDYRGTATRTVWYDDVVVARSYIGPKVLVAERKPETAAVVYKPTISEQEQKRGVAEKQAARLFQMARQAERMGQRSVARRLYAQIVEKHPKTDMALKAKEKLE